MKPVLTSAQGRLLRALLRVLASAADRQSPAVIVQTFDSSEWSSLTFAGHRHSIGIVVPGDRVPILDALEVAGQIVAEASIVAVDPVAGGLALTIAIMTVDHGV